MALNFTVSYTFSPNTTISSSQVNTNTSDVANVFTGLEAKTKSFAFLKVDGTPTTSTDVAIKSYVDSLMSYRRPNVKYVSAQVVEIETGLNGTSGQAAVLFPDGNIRTDSTTSRIRCTMSQNAVLSGTAQGGLRSGSVSANTYYAFYAVKTSDNSSNFVFVADSVLPLQANYTTLNSNFGTNSWVYLATVRYGDGSSATTSFPSFAQTGSLVYYTNVAAGLQIANIAGYFVASTSGATSLQFNPSSGTGAGNIPDTIGMALYQVGFQGNTGVRLVVADAGDTVMYDRTTRDLPGTVRAWSSANSGIKLYFTDSASKAFEIGICAYVDKVLGVGANPLL